ncbi:MAG: motif [Deltaproteobacteria bacterium]|nr:motif [Deltaproteobacteria bacterium]
MKNMLKFIMVVVLVAVPLFMGSVVTSQASPMSVVLDEYGVGFYRDLGIPGAAWQSWPGLTASDGHLYWIGLRATTIPDPYYYDVIAFEYGTTDVISDVVRFYTPPASPDYVFVSLYSDIDGDLQPADTGIPTDLRPSPYRMEVTEQMNETFNFVTPNGDEFLVYSEGHASVPEPATMLLLGIGLVGLAGVRRKFIS